MIVWGGNRYSERRDKLDSGGRYDPVADRWLSLPMSGLTARDDPRAVWTGSEMIVWGGRDSFDHTGDGARYSPSNDRWRAVSASGAPEPREDHTAIWTGSEMIVWGGWNGDEVSRNYALDGGRYDPRADRWRPISRQGAPDPREDHSAIWTGTEMIVWGGVRREPNRDDDETIESADDDAVVSESSGTRPDRRQLATGGRYDPATDTWTPITLTRAPEAREDGVVVWTGTDMLVWGGQQAGVPLASGARYVASADTWCAIDGDGAPPPGAITRVSGPATSSSCGAAAIPTATTPHPARRSRRRRILVRGTRRAPAALRFRSSRRGTIDFGGCPNDGIVRRADGRSSRRPRRSLAAWTMRARARRRSPRSCSGEGSLRLARVPSGGPWSWAGRRRATSTYRMNRFRAATSRCTSASGSKSKIWAAATVRRCAGAC
jgi:hypothetical protein